MDFKFYFSLFLRRLHWFLLFVVIGSAIGLTLAKVLPPVYVAHARLLVESEQIPGDLASSTVRMEAAEQLEIIQQRILTRETLVDMANRLNIYQGTQAERRMSTESLVSDMRKRISITTTVGASGSGKGGATFVTVGFKAPTAQMAATVTNELVTLILRADVTMRTGTARQTLEFFQQEVDRLDGELSKRGATILEFKQGNQEALPESLDFRRSQQAAGQERLLQLEREEAMLRDQRSRRQRIYEFSLANGIADESAASTPEQKQLRAMEEELASQLVVLSPSNPKIKILEARIASQRSVVEAQVARQAAAGSDTALSDAPLSDFEAQMAEIDGQIEFIAEQKEQVKQRLENLAVSIRDTPSNTITLDTLERDYANLRAQYDHAVSNMARAATGDVIEALRQGQRISIVEQAITPNKPEKPNRLLIAAGGVGGGMVLGLVVVLLLELLNKGIRRPEDVTAALGITPFATIPYYRTTHEKSRRRSIILGAFGACLIGIPLILWIFHSYIVPLDQLFNSLGQGFGLAALMSNVTIALG
ncbi:MAG: lipopolysaccharide biosynthesis protein [Rhodobacterales bacterium]|nr:lipopolysaccharide biosynthesis protein [Rhodobacterales bacterium]